MTYQTGFNVRQAESREFARYWAVYRGAEDFPASYVEGSSELVGVPFCRWFYHQGQRVGGCVMRPNHISDIFVIPPFEDWTALVADIQAHIVRQSQAGVPIVAEGIPDEAMSAFEAAGYRLADSQRWLLRPTSTLPEDPEPLRLRPVQTSDAEALTALLQAAYTHGVHSPDVQAVPTVEGYFAQASECLPCHAASACHHDAQGQLCGAVLLNLHHGQPMFYALAVHPAHRGHGIGRGLIEHAVRELAPHFAYVKLVIQHSNPAQPLFRRLGFAAGKVMHRMVYT